MKAVLHIYILNYIEFDGMVHKEETSLSFKHAFHSYLHVFQGHHGKLATNRSTICHNQIYH